MHKKLYKAKKNWVIGLVAGSILMFGSAMEVSADDQLDTQNNANTSTSSVAQNIEQVANENDSLAKSNSANNQAITTETQTNNSNNTQVNTSIQDEFPNKATIFGNGGGSYSDISPSNTAKLVNNSKREGVISDDDPTLLVPAYRSHFDKHIAPHETLFSKNINRRGQHYVIGMASEGENATFLNYVQNGDTLAIACGTGISKNPYTLAGQYYGASFSGGANIEWNAHHAISFGQARTNNDNKIETTLDANMQNNGVMNYTISWKNDSNKEFDYFGSSVYPKDQPFSFDIGNLEGYSSEPEFLLSPIWQISDDIYFNYALTDKYTDNPQYTLQFIKVDKNSIKVMSSLDSSWASVYDSGFDVPGKSIPGLPVFVPENAKSYPSGIVVYPPIDGRKIKDEHQGTGIVALDNKTPERTIKFQRVFMNANELKGMNANQILAYVYGLFNGEDEKNRKEKDSVTTVIYQERNGNIVEKINLPNSNQNTINIKNLNEELSKKAIHFKDKSGEDQIGHYEISDLSQYKDTIPTGKASVILVEFIVDFDLKKANKEYVVDQAVDAALDKIGEQIIDYVAKNDTVKGGSSLANIYVIKPLLHQNKIYSTVLDIVKGMLENEEIDNAKVTELEKQINLLEKQINDFLQRGMDNVTDSKSLKKVFVNLFRGEYSNLKNEYLQKDGEFDFDKMVDKGSDALADTTDAAYDIVGDNKVTRKYKLLGDTVTHFVGETVEAGYGVGHTFYDGYTFAIKNGFTKENAVERYDAFYNNWMRSNNVNAQGIKVYKGAMQGILGESKRRAAILNMENQGKGNESKRSNSLLKVIGSVLLAAGIAFGVVAMNGWSEKKNFASAKNVYGVRINDPVNRKKINEKNKTLFKKK